MLPMGAFNECASLCRRRTALGSAWGEFIIKGYDRFTIGTVAKRACRSRVVVYHRWAGKAELMHAATARAGANERG